MTKNDYIKDSIKDKSIDPSKVCYMNQEDIEPEKYKHILEKELEEYRKNNKRRVMLLNVKNVENVNVRLHKNKPEAR